MMQRGPGGGATRQGQGLLFCLHLEDRCGGEGACAEDRPLSVPSMLGWGLGTGWKEWAVFRKTPMAEFCFCFR